MAADENILKSFLYQIGAKIDEPSVRKASETMDKLSKSVLAIGASIEGLALTLAAATVKIADSFEDMYYASRRTGATIKAMKVFDFTISQLGGTAEAAQASVEGLADQLQRNPGLQNWIKGQFGVDRRDANGKLKDTATYTMQIYKSAAAMFNSGNTMRALRLIDQIHFDKNVMLAAGNPDYDRISKGKSDSIDAFGTNLEETGRKSAKFMQQVRDLGGVLSDLKDSVFARLEDSFGGKLEDVTKYIAEHKKEIADWVTGLVTKIIELERETEHLVTALGGWKTVSEELLGLWIGGKALGAIANVMKFFGAFAGASAVAGTAGAAATAVGVGAGTATALAAGGALLTAGGLAYGLSKFGGRPGAGSHPGMTWQSTGHGGYWKQGSSANGLVDYFVSQGWSKAQASGIAARLLREDGDLDPSKEGDLGRGGYQAYGIGQWHRARQDEFRKWSGHSIKGSSLAEQLAFVNYELTQGQYKNAGDSIRKTGSARAAGAATALLWSQMADKVGEPFRTGADADRIFNSAGLGVDASNNSQHTTINNDIDVNVSGADPQANGAAVLSSIKPWAAQTRNTKGVVY